MLDLALLKAEIETGMYKKPIDALAKDIAYQPVPEEIRTVVISSWRRGGSAPRCQYRTNGACFNSMPTLTQSQLEALVNDPEVRRAAAKTLKGFCLTYLPHHFPLDPSDFFDEMCAALENGDTQRLEIIGFRGCAKSTVASLALVLWAALEHPDKYPFIIMLADTRSQASINAASVQHELRNNDLILKDYGHLKYKRIDDPRPEPTLESDEDWQAMNCVLDNGVRILSRSRGQKLRGLKHRQFRPSLIIADDVEDLDWVRTQENRDKSDRWMRGNVLPSIDEHDGRMVIIGNWLHTDGLMARLKNTGIFKVLEFPLLREGDGTEVERCTWRAKYPTQEAIDRKRDELGDSAFGARCFCRWCRRKDRTFIPRISTTTTTRHSTTAITWHMVSTWQFRPRRARTSPRSYPAR